MAADPTITLQMDFPVVEPRFDTMPYELLEEVARFLAPDNTLDHADANCRAAYKKGMSDLLNLCLVSKMLEAVVRPAIFRNIIIWRSTELILLYRTLTENHGVGGYIKTLVLSTAFLRCKKHHEMLDLQLLGTIDSDFDLVRRHGSLGMTSRQENELRSNLYLKVLEKAPSVKEVTLNTPRWAVRGLDDGQLPEFGIASAMANSPVVTAQNSSFRLPQALHTLTIEGQYQGLVEGLPGQFHKLWSQKLNGLSNLKTMVWLRDDTTWFDSLPGRQWATNGFKGTLQSLTALKLIDSSCRFFDIAIVCDSFPSLKSLDISSNFLRDNPRMLEGDSLSPGTAQISLTRSIAKLQHLEYLSLDLLSVPDNSKLLGDDGVLDLSSLPTLFAAAISFRLFVSHETLTSTGSRVDPSLVLPRCLALLVITVRGFSSEAGSNLMEFLGRLREACSNDFPSLGWVKYRYAAGIPPLSPSRTCLCARVPHEDFCTYDHTSGLLYTYRPWVPAEKFEDLVAGFGQRGIELTKATAETYASIGV
ncbi:hypothetical protein INS49_010480 [Diaporthe citri]|uniref:uncharacterized protein n=1 Tax=Diaporthe citri TaxID=83186 RepID=UPI001C825A15|nr:uncharacterized protein INS49_010480 [Diaporthe citri]KAG6362250.1 hypothetical protein INS49_010480 [Diaporthe citri]